MILHDGRIHRVLVHVILHGGISARPPARGIQLRASTYSNLTLALFPRMRLSAKSMVPGPSATRISTSQTPASPKRLPISSFLLFHCTFLPSFNPVQQLSFPPPRHSHRLLRPHSRCGRVECLILIGCSDGVRWEIGSERGSRALCWAASGVDITRNAGRARWAAVRRICLASN